MNKETYLTEYPKHESMREIVKKDKKQTSLSYDAADRLDE